MSSLFSSGSRELLVLAIVFSVLAAQGQNEEELERMAAFFDVVSDVLALFALQPGLFQGCTGLCESSGSGPAEADPSTDPHCPR